MLQPHGGEADKQFPLDRNNQGESAMRSILILLILLMSASCAQSAGIVQSHKTGAIARVAAQYAGRFQAYIDDLEAHGARIRFMGGYRRGHCSPAHLHPCGKALDVCQLSRDRVDPSCHLPSRMAMIRIAAQHDLSEGGQWCHGDRGHVQAMATAGSCGSHTMSARRRMHRTPIKTAAPIADRFSVADSN
jgi:hypothetical protein